MKAMNDRSEKIRIKSSKHKSMTPDAAMKFISKPKKK
jgi:hypothetical protein